MSRKNLILIVICFSLFIGCSENFLETKPEGTYGSSTFFEKPEQVRMLTRSMYGRDWYYYLEKPIYAFGELCSGNGTSNDPDYIAFMNGNVSGDMVILNSGWKTIYGVITRANVAMRNLNEMEVKAGSDMETAKTVTMGECRFFRAYCYFLLVNHWGAVPVIMDNVTEFVDVKKPKIVTEDIYEIIIRDLTDAVDKLPAKSDPKYLSKLSAKALLAKVYLTRAGMNYGTDGDFTQARDLAKEVIDGASAAGYGLMTKYHDLWLLQNNNNKESLFAFQWAYNTGNDWEIQNCIQAFTAPSDFTGSWDGWSAAIPSIDLVNSWESGDLRRYSTIMEDGNYYPEFWKSEGGYTYHAYTCSWGSSTGSLSNVRKHLAGKDNSSDGKIGEMNTEVYTPLIRLADLYLTYAEAVLAKNTSTADATALEYVNTLRTRANLPGKTSLTYSDIYNERRHEFAWEFQNWMDVIRYYRLYPTEAKTMLQNQERGFYNTDPGTHVSVIQSNKLANVIDNYFVLPFPGKETLIDPLLLEDPVKFDFSKYQ